MIKKIFHFICFVVAGVLFTVALALLFRVGFAFLYHIDILSPTPYRRLAKYWNNGGILKSKDLVMLFLLFSYVPLCLFVWYRLYKFKFTKLITTPLNWLVNLGTNKYTIKDVNIKNLKVEEKKTLEQVVQERINQENKKNPLTVGAATDFRKRIVEKIEENKNN